MRMESWVKWFEKIQEVKEWGHRRRDEEKVNTTLRARKKGVGKWRNRQSGKIEKLEIIKLLNKTQFTPKYSAVFL